MVIATGWGLAVMAGVFTAIACGSEGHLNPAVTLARGIVSGDFSKVAWYIAAQLLGRLREHAWSGCTTCLTGAKHRRRI